MDAGSWPNLAAMFFEQAARLGERPFLWAKRQGVYKPLTWGDVAARVTPLARGLLALGVEPGDRVALVSENRPAWLVADVAIMSIGAVTVPAYTTNTEADHLHVLADSGAKGVIVSSRRLAETVIAAARKSGGPAFVAAMDPPEPGRGAGVEVLHLDSVIEQGRARGDNVVALAGRWRRADPACIIYTSGTGGAPKGVVLAHGSILHNCAGALQAIRELGLGHEVFLSFLPLSHSYEHTAGQFFPMSIGAEIYYAEGVESLAANMLEARPTIMTAVPRLYETLHQRIQLGVRKSSRLKRRLFEATLALGRRRLEAPEGLRLPERLLDAVLDRLVRAKVRARFGGRLKAMVSGGAPLNPEIGTFFAALGLRILQGYGQTEAAPVVSCNRARGTKMHTVGPPLEGVEVKIAEDGEILVRGELVMRGYWRNEAATRDAIRDGWLHTGDIGIVDGDGHLVITDRKKDIIVVSGGDNVAPQRIEGMLTLEPEIAQAVVHGDKRPHLVALLVPDAEWAKAWAGDRGQPADLASLARDDDFRRALGQAVERVNARLSPIEKVRRFAVAEAPFTVENQQLTPTLKPRRHKIRETYGAALDALYG
jgi:long-chain acyl-CoA synthetase